MKKIIASLLVGVIIGITLTNAKSQIVEVKSYSENGNIIKEYSDNSVMIMNEDKDVFTFYPSNLSDWGIEVNNKEELNNVVSTYLELNNNK